MPKAKLSFKDVRRQCNKSNLFEDPDFCAVNESLFFSQKPPRPFEWKRPHELCEKPQLFVEGASRFDIAQGMLGDCWFLAALASLSLDDYLLFNVCPKDQDFERNYCGAFYFRFWQYGKWEEVVIDDRLPTYNGQLVFVHSKEKNEFWSALLEKAYAKLHGSYEHLKGGNTIEAMEDFTGGFSESHDLRQPPKKLFKIMFEAYSRDSQMGCSLDAKPNEIEAKCDNGLIKGHAYTITDVRRVKLPGRRSAPPVKLIRIRNPWGQKEWNGRWSDESNEWKSISERERKDLGLVSEDDGEFWMEYSDFIREFHRVDICHLDPVSSPVKTIKSKNKKWVTSEIHGRWQKSMSAGGCRNFPDTFWVNPQIEVRLEEEDDEDDDDDDETPEPKGCTVMIGLLQKNRRKQMKMGVGNLTMGFALYEYKDDKVQKLPKDYFLYNASKARSPTFINTREIMGRFKLAPGRYCIVPSTFEPNQEGDFLIRIYTLKGSYSVTLDEKTGIVDTPAEITNSQSSQLQSAPPPSRPERKAPEAVAAEEAMKCKFNEFFKKITGDDMEVDAWELMSILNSALKNELRGTDGFSIDACKSMVAAADADRSGKLGIDEFMELWTDISKWKKVFGKFDLDKSGSFSTYELREALRSIGYSVSGKVMGALVLRFADKHGQINLDEFITCTTKLKHLINSFKTNESRGVAQYNMDEFLALGMYS